MDKIIKILIWTAVFCVISFSVYYRLSHGVI